MLLFLIPLNVASAQVNRQSCIANLDEAGNMIADGFFNETIALLEPCSTINTLQANEQTRLFKLLANAYLAKQYVSQARDAIAKILDISPNFAPDINLDSQLFRNLVGELQAARTPPMLPQGFDVAVNNDQIRLAWTTMAETAEIAQILILRGTSDASMSTMDSVSATTTEYTDTGAIPGTTYYYALQTMGSNGVASLPSEIQQAGLPIPAVITEIEPPTPERVPKASSRKKLVFLGGGILVAGGVAAAIVLSGGDPDPGSTTPIALPGPPAVP